MDFTFVISVLTFNLIILALTAAVVVSERKLKPHGHVKIIVNDDESKPMETETGSSLLSTLASQKLFIPSACGGGGTCGMCKVQVLEGGGDVLPTEIGHLSRAERKSCTRLSCQVKVRNNMRIHVPEELFSIKNYDCEVVSNNNVATFIKELVLRLPKGENLHFKSGGYIQIEVPKYETIDFRKDFDIDKKYHEDWDALDFWKYKVKLEEPIFRAYSMANHPAEGNIVMLNIRIANPPPRTDHSPGKCSSYVFSLKPGDKVRISGAYGEFFINETQREMVYIGGGAGMAPMRSHLFHLFHTEKTQRKVSFWYGARSKREIFYQDQFDDIAKKFPNFNFKIGLSDPKKEDNWDGYTGFIHNVLLQNYLKNHPDPTEIEYYMCGPPMMIDAVIAMLNGIGVEPEMIRFDKF